MTLSLDSNTPKLSTIPKPKRVSGIGPEFCIAQGDNRFRLPGGLRHSSGWLRDVELRPMNGFDEEALATSETRRSTTRMMNVLISRTMTKFGDFADKDQIRALVPKLLIGDRLALLFMLHKISDSDILMLGARKCPRPGCGHEFLHPFDLDSLQYDAYLDQPPPETIPVDFKGTQATLRLLTGEDEEALQEPGEGATLGVLRNTVLDRSLLSYGEYARNDPEKPLTTQVIRGLTLGQSKALNETLNAYNPGPVSIYEIPCEKCGEKFRTMVQPQYFFRL